MQLILFETAKLAKEKGFNEPCRYIMKEDHSTEPDKLLDCINKEFTQNSYCASNDFTIPTQSLLKNWLWETHNIYIEMNISYDAKINHFFVIHNLNDYDPMNSYERRERSEYLYNSYEKALEAALLEGLKLIEKI